MATKTPANLDAGTERRIGEALALRERDPERRERLGSWAFAVAFPLAGLALAALAPARPLNAPLALAMVVALAICARIELSFGSGYGVATQLVFVPMLVLLPAAWVAPLAGAGMVLPVVLEAARGRTPWSRCVIAVGNGWFALGPAAVLAIAQPGAPAWSHWPVYVAALAAQFAVETAVSALRFRVCWDIRLPQVLTELRSSAVVDALLAPVGLLAGIGAAAAPAASLLVLPLAGLLAMLAREREGRIAHSLELGRAYRGTALLLRDLLEEDDEYTGHHTEDVVELSAQVARQMGLDEDLQRETELGALLHDIGKIHIPDAIINKPGKLDDAEWAIMKTHTIEGQKMLDQVGGLLGNVGIVVRASHERFDGRGYPDGLAGQEIPLPARIVSACDAFNAMTTDRSYRKALPLSVAVQEMRDNAGTQFDPAVVEALLAVVGDPGWEVTLAALAAAPAPISTPQPTT
jgi:putative nucleotidyltransferase with HDIG domain